jgi:hypothetical protein
VQKLAYYRRKNKSFNKKTAHFFLETTIIDIFFAKAKNMRRNIRSARDFWENMSASPFLPPWPTVKSRDIPL